MTILVVAALLTVASVWVSAARWKFQSDRNLLISNKLDWNQRFIDVQHHFPGAHDQIVVIDAGASAADPKSKAYADARKVADELGQALRQDPHVSEAVWGATFSPRVLRLAPMDQFKARLVQIAQSAPMLESPTPEALMGKIAQGMMAMRTQAGSDADTAASIQELNRLIAAMGKVIEQGPAPATQPLDFGAMVTPPDEDNSNWHYLTSENGRLLFIRVTPRLDREALDAITPALEAIRSQVARVAAGHPGVEIGITGIEVMEADETAAATWDSTWTSILAAVLITALLITAYHGWRTPFFAMVALVMGIAWSYGFLFITVGHLQVLSIVFNIMLLGLGTAYGIYLSSAFELLRHQFPDNLEGFTQALAGTLKTMGPGIATGALTTAAAFGTTIFTDFTGVAEMGFIAGVGILLCLIAMFTVYPALLRLFKADHRHIAPMESRYVHFFEERWVMPFVRWPKLTLAAAAVLTLLSVGAIFQMRFDYDLIKLQPRRAPSVQWQERIVRDGKQSIWFALAITNSVEEARALGRKFLDKSTVGGLGGIGLLFPPDDEAKTELIKKARAPLSKAIGIALATPAASQPSTAPATISPATISPAPGPDLFTQLGYFRALMGMATVGNIPAPIKAALADLGKTLGHVSSLGLKYTPEERKARLDHLTTVYQAWRLDSARQIDMALNPTSLEVKDLPAEVIRSYMDDRGRFALEVYPSLTKDPRFRAMTNLSPLDPRFLPVFIADVKSVDREITGVIVQIYRSGQLIEFSYVRAGIIALLIVFAVVYLDFRSLRDSLLILLPVAMAFVVTFGLMWLIGMTINMANIIVLPLMFGIGVDSGVHVLNRYRQHPDDQPVGLTHGTGKGITITCITSVISFAVMMLSSHRGIASLGFVLSTGLAMTMLACWTVMPAWLQLRHKGAIPIKSPGR
ncbi:MAG: MMPL family transporter [Planctomycetes bacterium]|nr:MMPL family transporter [Planctomycetota bacterium]